MLKSLTKRGWREHIASLRRKATAGDLVALTDLGLTLLEGIQTRHGQSIVRKNSRAAIVYLRDAAVGGDSSAASALGYVYDRGLGTRRDVKKAVLWYLRAARRGSGTAASNLATVYRDAGKLKLAFQWWKRAAAMRDGDAAVDVGYCYQYGIGTRSDAVKAKRMYRSAMKSRNISEHGREAAMYHLALALIDEGKAPLAAPLLKRASSDDDYPEAAAVLDQLRRDQSYIPCRCRRFITKTLRGHAECFIHRR